MGEMCGLGIDCEEISRFRKLNDRFFTRNFTQKEIEYCRSRPNPYQHFAGRFACKEALIKAFGSVDERLTFSDIEVLNSKDGVPGAMVTRPELSGYGIKVSISHSGGMAVAAAVISRT